MGMNSCVMGAEEIKKDMDITSWPSDLAYEQWVALPVSGARPSARYKHAAAVADENLYITGGSRNGRYLSDIQAFDLRSLTWSSLKLEIDPSADKSEDSGLQEVLPGISDHSMVARGGHSVTLVGSKLIVFGGEDRSRKLLNDVHALDLQTMTWSVVEATQTPPAPRFDHSAAVHSERYLLIFGGCSHSIFFNDLHVLDLHTMEWSQPQVQGDLVSPRAGHAGISIDEMWYIVGGGDNNNGCPETLALNMSKLVWSTLTTLKERHPLASEGLSICSAIIDGGKYLVAFGGYNGKYNNESEKLDFPQIIDLNFNGVEKNVPKKDINLEINAIKEEKVVLESSIDEARAENSRLREKIDELKSNHTELSKELQSVQSQLISERSRCFKLEPRRLKI
ncbi:hypothetical protein GOBAR_DD06012 [Gossypium barbadense]|nr:hypothetical protein GOBAR_DD06012 [Gossypium barbadense]